MIIALAKAFGIYWLFSGGVSFLWGIVNCDAIEESGALLDITKELNVSEEKAKIILFVSIFVFGFIALPVALYERFLK